MSQPIRVLSVEDSEDDAKLLELELKRAGYESELKRVETADEYRSALEHDCWDIIISDHTLPDFDSITALNILKEAGLDIPFVIMSGTISEDVAVEAMRSGAKDYVLKTNMKRLVPAIKRELKEAELRRERARVDNALARSEEYFRLLFDNAGEAILACDSQLMLTDINRIGCELTGYGREELLGKNILGLGILHPDDIENAATAIRRLFDGEDRIEAEFTFITKGGAERLFAVTGAAIHGPDGSLQSFTVICHDVTEERRGVKALLESERSLKIAQEMGLLGSWEFEIESHEITWSDETYVLYDRDPALGPPTDEEEAKYYSDEQSSILHEYSRRAIEEGRDFKYDLEARLPTGRRVLFAGTMQPVKDEGGRVIKLFGTVQDITERKKSEELIKKNAEELKDLIEIAAHELRHPATVFRGYAQILMANWEDLDRETIQDALSRIDEATNRLMRLVVSLLDTSHIERGKMDLSLSEVDPVAPVRLAIEEFRSRELDRELRLTCAGFDNEEMDAEKVKQVLEILIDNAAKYSDKGCPVDIECEKVEGEIVYRVADLGPGIPDEDRERIFERFYQVGDVLHHSVHGIGLGLYIAKAIVEVHEGWISEEPRDGGGSVFSFGIPCRP